MRGRGVVSKQIFNKNSDYFENFQQWELFFFQKLIIPQILLKSRYIFWHDLVSKLNICLSLTFKFSFECQPSDELDELWWWYCFLLKCLWWCLWFLFGLLWSCLLSVSNPSSWISKLSFLFEWKARIEIETKEIFREFSTQ